MHLKLINCFQLFLSFNFSKFMIIDFFKLSNFNINDQIILSKYIECLKQHIFNNYKQQTYL